MAETGHDLDVVVCGAGIGGLAAAAALRLHGIPTTVLEQAPAVGEVGAGLQLGPNATRVLHRLGLQAEMAAISLVVQETVQRRWSDGSIIAKTTLGASAVERYGAPYLQVHRADLHSVLLDAATRPDGIGPAARIVTSATVVAVDESDPTRPAAVTADGQRYAAAVVVGADGIRSIVREHIGGPTEVLDSGDMAFRCLIDGAAVREDPATRFLLDWQAGNFWFGDGRHLVTYPVRDLSLVNVVGVVPLTDDVARDWRRPATSAELVAAYDGWDSRVVSLLSKPSSPPVLWALKQQAPFATWSRGHVTLLGDACHAMVPYVSQGASQAVEDGYVLAEELSDLRAGADVASALEAYALRRADRARTVQEAANANRRAFHLPDGPDQRARDDRMRSDPATVATSLDFIYAGTPLRDEAVTPAHV